MKKIIALIVVTLGVTLTGFAQDKQADLKTLFRLMDSKKMIDAMMDRMLPALKQQGEQIGGKGCA